MVGRWGGGGGGGGVGGLSFHINKNNDTTVGKSKTFATEHVLGRLGRVLSKSCHDTGTCTPSNGFFGEREKKKKSFCHVETFPISAVSTPNVLVLTKTQNQKKTQPKKPLKKGTELLAMCHVAGDPVHLTGMSAKKASPKKPTEQNKSTRWQKTHQLLQRTVPL